MTTSRAGTGKSPLALLLATAIAKTTPGARVIDVTPEELPPQQ